MPRRDRRQDPAELRILSWNMKVGRGRAAYRAALLALVALCWPHAIALQEAKGFRGSLPGYRRHAAPPGLRKDAENLVILIRKGLVQSSRPLPVDNPRGWVHDRPKPARVFLGARVAWLTLVDLHRCTKWRHENRAEWDAEHHELARAGAATTGPFALVGDWNAHPDVQHPKSPEALARQIGGQIVADDEDVIDYAIVRGCRATIRRLRHKYGSDHHPRLLTLTRKES